MQHITTGSTPSRAAHARLAARLIGVGLYVVGSGLIWSHALARGTDSVGLPSAHISAEPPHAATVRRRATGSAPVSVSVIDGTTKICLMPAHLVATDAVMVTADEFAGITSGLVCR